MEIKFQKYSNCVIVLKFIDDWENDVCRLNSEMTKDLIKEEMRVRVLSFRPTPSNVWAIGGSYFFPKEVKFIEVKRVSPADKK